MSLKGGPIPSRWPARTAEPGLPQSADFGWGVSAFCARIVVGALLNPGWAGSSGDPSASSPRGSSERGSWGWCWPNGSFGSWGSPSSVASPSRPQALPTPPRGARSPRTRCLAGRAEQPSGRRRPMGSIPRDARRGHARGPVWRRAHPDRPWARYRYREPVTRDTQKGSSP